MVTISISPAAFEAIKSTLPKGAKPYIEQRDPNGNYRIALPRKTVDELGRLRKPFESYSDVILRLAKG